MVSNTQNRWGSGLSSSSGIQNNYKTQRFGNFTDSLLYVGFIGHGLLVEFVA
jgi:hypothetical protein